MPRIAERIECLNKFAHSKKAEKHPREHFLYTPTSASLFNIMSRKTQCGASFNATDEVCTKK